MKFKFPKLNFKKKEGKEKKTRKVSSRFDKKKAKKKYNINKSLSEFLEKAGIDEKPQEFNLKIIKIDAIIIILTCLFIILTGIIVKTPFFRIFSLILITITLILIALYLISVTLAFFYLDLKIYQRTRQLEAVLPDFLQLTSANISAGMPIDRALWLAVRPRFGVLAKEIEEIAKATIAGEDLNAALITFSKKYNSKMLRESINLLIAGLDAGGEVAELLNKISINIQETNLMQKEISANVMTYVIFIGVATILAAPFLFALSGQLLLTTKAITANVNTEQSGGGVSSALSFDFSGEGVALDDYNNFALLMIIISSISSVAIISVIRKGSVKEGIKLMPVFLAVSIVVFYLSKLMFASVMGGLF